MEYLLIVLTLLIAIAGLFKDIFPKRNKKKITLIIFILLLIFAGIQVYQKANSWRTRWYGSLKSGIKSNSNTPLLVLGQSQTRLNYTGSPDSPVIDIAGEPLYLRLIDGEVKLSVAIRDKNGEVLAVIQNNEWFVCKPPIVLDRNFDKNKLEVLDKKGEIVFQVMIKGAEAYLAGTFYSKDGKGPLKIRPFLHESPEFNKTLFKYPSKKYPNKLSKINK